MTTNSAATPAEMLRRELRQLCKDPFVCGNAAVRRGRLCTLCVSFEPSPDHTGLDMAVSLWPSNLERSSTTRDCAEALAYLLSLLSSDDWHHRVAACEGLAQLAHPEAARHLEAIESDPHHAVRQTARWALDVLGSPRIARTDLAGLSLSISIGRVASGAHAQVTERTGTDGVAVFANLVEGALLTLTVSDGDSLPSRRAIHMVRDARTDNHPDATLVIGQVLEGEQGRYEIIGLKDQRLGRFSETYRVKIIELPDERIARGSTAVAKVPRVPKTLSDEAAQSKLDILRNLLTAASKPLRMLRDVDAVATYLDQGGVDLRRGTLKSIFYVQEEIEGPSLEQMLAERYGSNGVFAGIPNADAFYALARQLTKSLIGIQSVPHGDLWPGNIRFDLKGNPVFVDFGQVWIALAMGDVTQPYSRTHRDHAYRAPEGGQSHLGDIFSIGGVLHYLATGEDPRVPYPDERLHRRDIDDRLARTNHSLYESDRGVVDIIARCMRQDDKRRPENAKALLDLIDTFSPEATDAGLAVEVEGISRVTREIEKQCGDLFSAMATARVRALRAALDEIHRGTFVVSGKSADIQYWSTKLVSALSTGDKFLAVTLPKYWWPQNIGFEDIFLSMTRKAAHRGAIIKRVFVLDDSSLTDPYLQDIVTAQINVQAELGEPANYEVRFVRMTDAERAKLEADGHHFGLLITRTEQIAMYPSYNAAGDLTSLVFRKSAGGNELRAVFQNLMSEARPLNELSLPVDMSTLPRRA
jgi:serine/threonine protein kinase